MEKRKFDLEDRLVGFAVLIISITESLNNTKAGNHIAGQLVRSAHLRRYNMVKHKVQNQEMILFIN